MKLLVGIIVALFAAVGLALILKEDPGYALLSIGHWTIETSVAVFVFFLIVAFFVVYLLIRSAVRVWQAPRQLLAANQRRRLRRSQQLLARGMRELAEGHWKTAEIIFIKGVDHSRTPALHYIGAARAAQKLRADERRDGYLSKATDLANKDILAVKLTRAELLLEDKQPAKARDILVPLYGAYPRQPKVLELLAGSFQELGDWAKLQDLLPELGKRAVFDEPRYTQLQLQVYGALLADTARTGTLADLRALWKQIPKALRSEEPLLIGYAGHLRDHDGATEAEALLRDALSQRWSDKLVVGYGELGRGSFTAQLATAERWLKQHDNDPYLLLTLGRLAKRGHQFDKARAYLEQSIALLANPDAYQELGEVLEETGDKEIANQYYRTSLRLLSGRPETKEGVALLSPIEATESGGPTLTKKPQKSQPAAS